MSGAWKLPMSPSQANSRGFYFGPSGEAPWNCDLMWKHHVHGETKIQAKHRLRSVSSRPNSAVPWGVVYDASMETWSPFSERAEIPSVRPRTAMLSFRKTLARHPTEGGAWEAEHGKRNIFRKIEQLRAQSPTVHGENGESELQQEFNQSLIANTDLQKTIQWAKERVEARAREREEEEAQKRFFRERQMSISGHIMGGTAADNAAWMNADRRVERTQSRIGVQPEISRRNNRAANNISYEALLGRKEEEENIRAMEQGSTSGLTSRSSERPMTGKSDRSAEEVAAEVARGSGFSYQPRTASPYVRLVSGERIMMKKEKFLSAPKNLESENQLLRTQLKELQEKVVTTASEVKRLKLATPSVISESQRSSRPHSSLREGPDVINVWRADDDEGSEYPASRSSRRVVVRD